MNQGLYLLQTLVPRLSLTNEQRQECKQILAQLQTLDDSTFPDAERGFEGMLAAHNYLQDRNAHGVLIGGLAKAIYNRRRTKEELRAHKDVDVAILDTDFELIVSFAAGIDWWLPRSKEINLRTDASTVSGFRTQYLVNENDVILRYMIEDARSDVSNTKPGLYILAKDFVLDIVKAEVGNVAGPKTDYDVIEMVQKKREQSIKNALPSYVREVFSEYLIDTNVPFERRDCTPRIRINEITNEIYTNIVRQHNSGGF